MRFVFALILLTAACAGSPSPESADSPDAVSALQGDAAAGIQNGGFESGLASWTSSGTTATSATAHGGAASAKAGSSTAAGASSLSQTFTAVGTGALSFWYQGFCDGTVAHDWATATLKNNTGGSTATLLAKTCTNAAGWKQVTSAALVSGDSYTLTLTNEGEASKTGDNYTLFDDVAQAGGATGNDFTLAISPASATLAPGASTSIAISTTIASGSAETVALSVSGLPAGVTGALAASSVASGQSTTLTLTAASSAAGASGTFTITGSAASGSHAATGSIAVSGGASSGTTMTLVTEPSGGFSSVYSAINGATSTLDLVMYELVDTTATSALVAAGKRGVKVRVILDTNNEKSSNTAAYDTLKSAANVSVVWANASFHVTHEKSMVVDAAVPASALACIWTANLTSEGYADTRDFLLYENDPADIAAMESTFDQDFANGGGSTYSPAGYTPPTGDHLLWSPTNAQSGLLAVIDGAKSTLLLDEEELESTTLADALIARAKAGVSVKVAVTSSETISSLLSSMKAAGISIAEYPGTGTELYIHGKILVADQGLADETAFLGSINFSDSSLTANRELGLVFTDAMSSEAKSIIASLAATLESDVSCASDSSCTKY